MKRLYYKLLITVLVLAVVLPFIMRDRYGNYLMTLDDLKIPDLSLPGGQSVTQAADAARRQLKGSGVVDSSVVQVYKWRDVKGVWHYGEEAPQQGSAELMQIHTRQSSMPPEPAATPASTPAQPTSEGKLLDGFDLPLLHAAETLQEAQQLEQVLEARFQRQQEQSY